MTEKERQRRILTFLQTSTGGNFYIDQNGDFWNATIYIDHSQTFDTVTDPNVAYEGGKLFGEFIHLTQDFDPSDLVEVIPRFHDMSFRFEQFEEALQNASQERLKNSQAYIDIARA